VIAVTRRKMGVSISDIFFAGRPDTTTSPTASVAFFVQAKEYYPGFTPFKTQLIDLSRPEVELFGTLSSSTRYKINRAEREGLHSRVDISPQSDTIAEYANFYDEFARHKSLPESNVPKLVALSKAGGLALSSVTDASGRTLAAHAYVSDSEARRVRLLYSASHFRGSDDSGERNLIGRANRFLHWQEMVEFKKLGFAFYDLGGLPMDDSDPVKNAIAKFKLEFGGDHVIEYNGLIPLNILARAALAVRRKLV
jgi:hypothetical protein